MARDRSPKEEEVPRAQRGGMEWDGTEAKGPSQTEGKFQESNWTDTISASEKEDVGVTGTFSVCCVKVLRRGRKAHPCTLGGRGDCNPGALLNSRLTRERLFPL